LCACSRGVSWLCVEFEAKVLHLCEYQELGGVQHMGVLLLSWRGDILSHQTCMML
jgi:hypothetical protein